jgi:DNA polymerase-1
MDMLFNPNSSKQMQEFLFDFLELTPIKAKNDKGNFSVAEDVLTHYAEKEDVEFCQLLINMRKLKKAKNTYERGIRRLISEVDGQFHTDYWLNTTKTYRSSATLFQTIPKHGEIIPGIPWSYVRKVFTRKEAKDLFDCKGIEYNQPGWLIGEVDYVGAEVKVAAGIADDKQLIIDLNGGYDQHSHWAGVIFGINKSVDEIKKLHDEERFLAKNNFTFANLFGAGNTSIAEEFRKSDFYVEFVKKKFEIARQSNGFKSTWTEFFVSYSEDHIKECQDVFYSRYPDVKEWQEWVVKKYYEVGYVENPFGFRRRYPLKRNEIINHPIQSTSFHLLLHSLIGIERKLEELDLQSKIVGQVHDSGFLNIKFEEAEEVMDLVEHEMTVKPFDWIKKVNLEAEWELSDKSWLDLKLENKPFKAIHTPSGEEFKYNVMHWFSQDFGLDSKQIIDVLAKKRNKETDELIKLDNWEITYV